MKTREQKDQSIAVLKEEFKKTGNALVVSFQGLPVDKDWELRRALQAAQLNYRVVKNTIGRIAVEDTPLESLKEHFKGMTAVAYSDTDPVGLAKVLSKFAKENAKLTFKAGVVEGRAGPREAAQVPGFAGGELLESAMLYPAGNGADAARRRACVDGPGHPVGRAVDPAGGAWRRDPVDQRP